MNGQNQEMGKIIHMRNNRFGRNERNAGSLSATVSLAEALRNALFAYREEDSFVAYFGENRPESVVILQAVLGGYGAFLPLSADSSVEDAANEVSESGSSVLFYSASSAKEVESHRYLFPSVRLFIGLDRQEDSADGVFLSYPLLLKSGLMKRIAG